MALMKYLIKWFFEHKFALRFAMETAYLNNQSRLSKKGSVIDDILDRMIHSSRWIELDGDSLR